MESFYLTVASNASTNIFPQNSLDSFSNQLPHEIDVTHFKVALQSIFVDNKYGNVPSSILGTRNHFLLFLARSDVELARPHRICNISDFSLSSGNLAKTLNDQLNHGVKRVLVNDAQKTIEIVLTNCVLLVHKQINRYLEFGQEKKVYLGDEYVVLASEGETKTFASGKPFSHKRISPPVIKVQLGQMQQNVSEVSFFQDLAIIKVKEKNVYPFANICKRKEYFKLNLNRLTELSARLVDEENYPLHFGSGQPTFLKLQFKKFPMSSNVIRFSSLESREIFSNNNSSSFRIQLRQSINTAWDVALSSIYLPNKINSSSLLSEENFYISIATDGNTFNRVVLHDLSDFSTEGFVVHCNAKIAAAFPQGLPFRLVLQEDGNIEVGYEMDATAHISGMLAYLLAKAPAPDTQPFWVMEGQRGGKNKWWIVDFKRLEPHVVLLHCNFITPVVVGNTFGQVLQIIPYHDNNTAIGTTLKYEAQHLDFMPISMNDKTMMHFEMRNSDGNLITFKDNNAEIIITLVFREKM